MKRVVAMCGIAGAMLMTGCGQAEDAAQVPSSPTTGAVESVAPSDGTESAGPDVSQSAEAQDPTWIISDKGLGPFELGLARDTVLGELGLAVDSGQCPSEFLGDPFYPVIVTGDDDDAALPIESITVDTAVIEVDGQQVALVDAEGIGVGSSEADLLAAHPDAVTAPFDDAYGRVDRVATVSTGAVPIVYAFGAGGTTIVEVLINLVGPQLEYCG